MKFMIILAGTAAVLLSTATAHAQYSGRWCLNEKEFRGGGYFRCDFATYRQCMAARAANGEWCMRNPRYGGRPY